MVSLEVVALFTNVTYFCSTFKYTFIYLSYKQMELYKTSSQIFILFNSPILILFSTITLISV